MKQVRIEYISHAGADGSVYLREAFDFEIKLPRRWNDWSCGSSDENIRCQHVRNGTFAWEGESYIVSLKKVLLLF